MAEKNEKDLIGFDPLAWMNDSESENSSQNDNVEKAHTVDTERVALAEQNEEVDTVIATEPTIESDLVEGGNSQLILDSTLNIQSVSHLYEQLLVLLEGQDKIEIDASSVVTVDTATLQLLIVLKQSAVKLGKEIIFDFPSDKFIESAELLGLAEMLEIDQAAAGFF